jgi:predicted DNA-binding protein
MITFKEWLKTNKPQSNMTKLAVYMPEELTNEIRSLAENDCQAMSVYVRQIIVDHLKKHSTEKE